ncbi:MAG: transposase [Elusimicrobia bacterium]|nr:transposase [Elusimicrobiota bacterium]
MYKPKDTKTPPLFKELFPLGGALSGENRWLKLAQAVEWDKIEEIYARHLSAIGRPAKDARLVCGLLMVKWIENFTDERTVREFCENPYVQVFCGLEHFVTEENFVDAGIFYRARKKISPDSKHNFEDELISVFLSEPAVKEILPKLRSRHDRHGGLFAKLRRLFFQDE